MDKTAFVGLLKENLHPALVREVDSALPDDFTLSDNQNQNQGSLAEIASMKPEILRSIGIGVGVDDLGEEVMDNQNQNQGKMEDLARMKPAALQTLKSVLLGGGEEVMDNQNQNQGAQAGKAVAEGKVKPSRK